MPRVSAVGERAFERAGERALERASERVLERAGERALERASERGLERAGERALVEQVTVGPGGWGSAARLYASCCRTDMQTAGGRCCFLLLARVW